MPRDKRVKKPVGDRGQQPGMFNVSQSKVKTWRRCHYAYHLKYVEKLSRKKVTRPLMFGKTIHQMLEADAEGDDPFEVLTEVAKNNSKLFKAEQEMYGEIVEDIRIIMTEYFLNYEDSDFIAERHDGRNAEHVFNIEILPGVNWNGKLDKIGKTPNKLRWIMEHKTFNRRPGDDERWRNIQSGTYIRANDILGWKPVDGMCWDYIWSKPPGKPGLLADGVSMSQRNIDTLPTMVEETIKELKLKRKDYLKFLDTVAENRKRWFERIHTPVNEPVVDMLFNDFVGTIQQMLDGHDKLKDKNVEKHCGWCDFQGICRAELEGNDVEYVIEREYERKEPDAREIPDATD